MKHTIVLLCKLGLIASFFILTACPKKSNPALYNGVWVPGTVQQEGSTQNLAARGFPYNTFQLTMDGGSDKGTFLIEGAPAPFPATIQGDWVRNANTLSLSGAPQGFSTLQNVNVTNDALSFTIELTSDKIGTVKLNFNLIKNR